MCCPGDVGFGGYTVNAEELYLVMVVVQVSRNHPSFATPGSTTQTDMYTIHIASLRDNLSAAWHLDTNSLLRQQLAFPLLAALEYRPWSVC